VGLKPTFRDYLSVPLSRVKLSKKKLDSLTLEDGTDRQSRNIGFKPTYTA
jgi:hypothetical protein